MAKVETEGVAEEDTVQIVDVAIIETSGPLELEVIGSIETGVLVDDALSVVAGMSVDDTVEPDEEL